MSLEVNKRVAKLEHYINTNSYQVGPLTSGLMLINDSLRQCGDEHTRGSSYTVVLTGEGSEFWFKTLSQALEEVFFCLIT